MAGTREEPHRAAARIDVANDEPGRSESRGADKVLATDAQAQPPLFEACGAETGSPDSKIDVGMGIAVQAIEDEHAAREPPDLWQGPREDIFERELVQNGCGSGVPRELSGSSIEQICQHHVCVGARVEDHALGPSQQGPRMRLAPVVRSLDDAVDRWSRGCTSGAQSLGAKVHPYSGAAHLAAEVGPGFDPPV